MRRLRAIKYDIPVNTPYNPIKSYGIIGNTRSTALIAYDGSIDWCCMPRFDSPSIFGRILDNKIGGSWKISPLKKGKAYQFYIGKTNVLETVFELDCGRVKIIDFMPYSDDPIWTNQPEIHRLIKCDKGTVPMELILHPRFNYGKWAANMSRDGPGFTISDQTISDQRANMVFSTSLDIRFNQGEELVHKFKLSKGDKEVFVLSYGELFPREVEDYGSYNKLKMTEKFWSSWAENLKYDGMWKDFVTRSALVLRLLIYSPTGAMVAAATTSLPETVGGNRNWDYRFSWIRDSAFSLWAFKSLGSNSEAERYLSWLINSSVLFGHDLRPVYGIEETGNVKEHQLKFLEGYMGSKPVRIGNDAAKQIQLDVYGILLDAFYFSMRHGTGFPEDTYHRFVKTLAHYVCKNWKLPGHGIWEIRGERKHFVYSKIWSYVALDRAIRIGKMTNHNEDVLIWQQVMAEIKDEVLSKGWSDEKKSFVISYDSDELDSALLLIPLIKFLKPDDPRVASTVDAICKDLLQKDGLIYRYLADDGLAGKEGAFLACSFWLVACLAKIGRVKESKLLFEKLLSHSNHLGLYSEEVDPLTGEALGNFPQAFTHMGLISAASEINNALKKDG